MPFSRRFLVAALGALVGLVTLLHVRDATHAVSVVEQPTTASSTTASAPLDGTAARRHRFPRYFRFFGAGDSGCRGPANGPPTVSYFRPEFPEDAQRPVSEQVPADAIGWLGTANFLICLSGFDPSEPVVVRVGRPDGGVTATKTRTDLVRFPLLRGMPLGQYEVNATQGPLQAHGSIMVQLPSARLFDARNSSLVRKRERVALVLGGFPRRRYVRIGVYRGGNRRQCDSGPAPPRKKNFWCYRGSFVARADSQGQALPSVSTRLTPSGDYVFAVKGRSPGVPNCPCGRLSRSFQPSSIVIIRR